MEIAYNKHLYVICAHAISYELSCLPKQDFFPINDAWMLLPHLIVFFSLLGSSEILTMIGVLLIHEFERNTIL